MKQLEIGVQTARWYDEEKPMESLQFIKECGFEAIDYNISNLFANTFDEENLTSFFDKTEEELYEYFRPMKEAVEATQIRFSQAHGIGMVYYKGEDKKNEYLMRITDKMIAVCAYLKCPMLVIHPWTGWLYRMEGEHETNMQIYRRLMPTAKKYGVKICLENYPHSDAKEACEYIDDLNAEAGEEVFGYCYDVGHAIFGKQDAYQDIVTLGKRLIAVHLHENNGEGDTHQAPFTQVNKEGNGPAFDWENVIKALRGIGYDGALSFETFNAIKHIPKKMKKPMLNYINEVGKYLREQIAK